jgi:acetyltransferase-like isoleucine patch superfamily enzyme
MRGSRIKDGSVIGANSLVMGKINEHILMMNEPAREFSKINWSTKGFKDD